VTGLTDQPPEKFAQIGWRAILVNLALLQNIFRYPNVEMPLWSLPWEVQMYLFLPAFYLFMKKYDQVYWPIIMWFVAATAATTFTSLNVPRAFHGTIFPPMFIGGMIAYRMLGRVRARFPWFVWPLAILGLLLARCLFMQGVLIDTARNATVNAIACLLLGVGIPFFDEIRSHLLSFWAHQIAKYSYGIYLLHVPSYTLVFDHMPWLPVPLKIVAALTLTGAASVIAYHIIEDPLIQWGRSIAKRVG
jgi:peptidoglycan/LPS O-acetylase OafA/YrhL